MNFIRLIIFNSFLISSLYADLNVVVSAAKNNHTDKIRYFNKDNVLTITVTESGSDTPTGNAYYIMAAFSNSDPGGNASLSFDINGWIDLQNHGVGLAALGDDNTHSYTINLSTLTSANGGVSPNGRFVDFAAVRFGDASPTTGEKTLILVDNVDGDATADNLEIDSVDPDVSVGWPANNNGGFNIQKITYTLNETVVAGSFLRFRGTQFDTGNHDYTLGGADRSTSATTKNPIVFTSGGDLQEAARYAIDFYLLDQAGNDVWRTNERYNVYFDSTPPRITTIAGNGASDNTIYGLDANNNVPLRISFNEGIYTSGVMNLVFNTGKTQTINNFASYGGRVTNKTFNYTVQAGDDVGDLTVNDGGISMASGQVIDVGYNAMANFSLTGNNLAASHNITVDGVRPTITKIESDSDNGVYGIGAEITLTLTFSENVTLSGGNLVVTMETGDTDTEADPITSISDANTATTKYTVVAGDDSDNINVKSVAGTLKDAALNAMTNMTPATNLSSQNGKNSREIETERPYITNITSPDNNGYYGVGETVRVRVTFNEAVTLSGANAKLSVPLETGDNDYTVEITTISNATYGEGNYVVAEGHTTNGADLTTKSNPTLSGTIKDAALNELDTGSGLAIPGGQDLDDTKNIKIDATYPVITNATSSTGDGTYKISDDINIQLDFSETVTLANANLDLTLNTGNGNKGSITTFSEKNTRSVDYTIVEGDVSARLDITTIALAAGATLQDAGGNAPQSWTPNTAFTANKNIIIDGVRPTIAKITTSKNAAYYGVGEIIDVQVHFSENVSTTNPDILKGTLETGSTNADKVLTYGAIDNAISASINYEVRENDYSASLSMKTPLVVTAGQKVNDQAGTSGTANEMTDKAIPDGKNLNDEVVDIFVDGEYPVDDGTAITVTAKGGNVVSGKFNTTNTSADFGVKLSGAKLGTGSPQSDITLVGGTIQMQAKINPNGWTNIGDPYTITSNDVNANLATLNVLEGPIEGLNGFATGASIIFKATVTDRAANAKEWAESSNQLEIDVTLPTITSATSTSNAGLYKVGSNINVTLGFSETVKLFNDGLNVGLNTGHTLTIATNDIDNVNTKSSTYQVVAGEATPDITGASTDKLKVLNVSVGNGQLRDSNGNPMTLPVTSIPTKISDSKEISVDGIAPDQLKTSFVNTSGGVVRKGYFNNVNENVLVDVPLTKTDATLIDGAIKIKARLKSNGAANNWTTVSTDWDVITNAELTAGTKKLTVTKAEINAFIGQDLNEIEFTADVKDKAGNVTEQLTSDETLVVDRTLPTVAAVGAVTSVGGTVVSDYWNSTNSSVDILVDFEDNDVSLQNGQILIIGSENDVAYTDFGDTLSISAGIYAAGNATVSIDSVIVGAVLGFEELPFFSEGDNIRFKAKVLDRAGNEAVFTVSSSTLIVKQFLPTVTKVTSANDNKAYGAGSTISIQIVGSEVLNVTNTPRLKLETGATDALISYASGTESNTLVFTYPVIAPHTSDDLNYFDESSLTLGGTDFIRDNFGNPLTLDLPPIDDNNSLLKQKDLVIDTTPPSVRFTYNDADSLVRKETGTLIITATFSDSIQVDNIPTISVDFPSKGTITTAGTNGTATSGDLTAQNMTRVSGTVYTYNLPLIDDSDGKIIATVDAKDKALNSLVADSTFDGDIIIIDNLDPVAFNTGGVTLYGDTLSGVHLGVQTNHWFNRTTDSLRVTLPIDITDNSLLRGNIQLQMQVDGKMASTDWETILPKDTLETLASTIFKFRTKKEILDILTSKNLTQGDTVWTRGLLNDQVGNTIAGAKSESFFILDTIPPSERSFINDKLFTRNNTSSFLTVNRDTTFTNDTLRFAWSLWPDSSKNNQKSSGLSYFRYSVYQSTVTGINPNPNEWSLWRDFKNLTTDTLYTLVDSLRHDRQYYAAITAVDSAGNNSDTVRSSITLRYNMKPNIVAINDTTLKEDIEWKRLIEVRDEDVATLLGDAFTYQLITMAIDTITSDSTVITNLNDDVESNFKAKVSTSGELTFTPSPLDSTEKNELYLFRIIVADDWVGTKDDTLDINAGVLAVNDNPIIDLSAFEKYSSWGYKEGGKSDTISLYSFAYDEDNDTLDLDFEWKILGSSQNNPSYPVAKLGFLSNVSKSYKNTLLKGLVDDYPSSTIMQKNNTFLVYSSGVSDLKDPVKVYSTNELNKVETDSIFAWIQPTDTTSTDTNYFTVDSMRVEFTVKDPGGLVGRDTIPFFINPRNDKPVWSGLQDTVVLENDSISFDFADYLTDTDDTLLTVAIKLHTHPKFVDIKTPKDSIIGDTVFYLSKGKNELVTFKPQPLWYDHKPANIPGQEGQLRNGIWNPNDASSNMIEIEILAVDDSGSFDLAESVAKDTFFVQIQRVPRPEIRMYVVQNNAFTDYYEIFLIDASAKTTDISLTVQSETIRLDTAADFTYVGNHYIRGSVLQREFDIYAKGTVGDTTLPTKIITFTMAKSYGNWSGSSSDGRFGVLGRNGSVDYDQTLMILDSSLFEPYFNDEASYLLGNESSRFKKSVQVSLLSEENELAIYQRSIGSGWVELPSYNESGQVLAYTDKMGYFKMGPKTLIVPGQTSLQQNYPNPFNPSTTIEYDLGFIDGPNQRVNITIYDILGRNIKTLVNEQQSIGRYQVKWNGRDNNEVPVSSGIYFVNLMTNGGRTETKKIMLMR